MIYTVQFKVLLYIFFKYLFPIVTPIMAIGQIPRKAKLVSICLCTLRFTAFY